MPLSARKPAPSHVHRPRDRFGGVEEEAAGSQGLAIRIGTTQIPASAREWIHKAGNEGLIKLVEDAKRGVSVGALSAGLTGGEVLGLLTLVIHAQVPTSALRDDDLRLSDLPPGGRGGACRSRAHLSYAR